MQTGWKRMEDSCESTDVTHSEKGNSKSGKKITLGSAQMVFFEFWKVNLYRKRAFR